jgi:hypothetical protein
MDSGRCVPFRMNEFYDRKLLETSAFPVLHGVIQFGGILLNRCIFDTYGTFREDLYTTQDYEFLFRVLRKEKYIYMDDIVNGVRCHPLQTGNTSEYMEKDRDEMYEMFLTDLTEEEQVLIYGSVYNFYYQMLLRLMPLPYTAKSFPICVEGLKHYGKSTTDFCDNDSVYIYGAGTYGRRLLLDLRCRGIQVQGFLDKNQKLKGSMVDGIVCHTLDEISSLGDINIIIASEEMAKILQDMGVKQYIYKEDYEREHNMFQLPPSVECVEEWICKYTQNNWKRI